MHCESARAPHSRILTAIYYKRKTAPHKACLPTFFAVFCLYVPHFTLSTYHAFIRDARVDDNFFYSRASKAAFCMRCKSICHTVFGRIRARTRYVFCPDLRRDGSWAAYGTYRPCPLPPTWRQISPDRLRHFVHENLAPLRFSVSFWFYDFNKSDARFKATPLNKRPQFAAYLRLLQER